MSNNECPAVYQRRVSQCIPVDDYFLPVEEVSEVLRGVRIAVNSFGVFLHHGGYSYQVDLDRPEVDTNWKTVNPSTMPDIRTKIVTYLLALLEVQPDRKDYGLQQAVYAFCGGAEYIIVAGVHFRWKDYYGYEAISVQTI